MLRPETEKHRAAYFAWYEAGRNSCRIAPNVAVPERTLRLWATKYDWQGRADKLDREVVARENAKAESEVVARIVKMRKRQRDLGEALVTLGGNYIAKNSEIAIRDIKDAVLAIEKGFALLHKVDALPDWVFEVMEMSKEALLQQYKDLSREMEEEVFDSE